jgi:hypothetical protein
MSPAGCCHNVQLPTVPTHWGTRMAARVNMGEEGGHMVNGWSTDY